MILDTVVLIDLEREITRGKAGPAMAALKRFAKQELFLTPTIAGELAPASRCKTTTCGVGTLSRSHC